MNKGYIPSRIVWREFTIFILLGIFAFVSIAAIMRLSKDNEHRYTRGSSNDMVAMALFQKMGYNPLAVNVIEEKDGIYCGQLINEYSTAWFRIGEKGLNVFQSGNIYYSTDSFTIQSVLEGSDLTTFKDNCILRTERNKFNAPYETIAIPETVEEDDEA